MHIFFTHTKFFNEKVRKIQKILSTAISDNSELNSVRNHELPADSRNIIYVSKLLFSIPVTYSIHVFPMSIHYM